MLQHLATFLTSWYDPSDNGFDIGDAGAILAFLLALAGVWAVVASATRKLDAWRDRRHRIDVEAIIKPHLDALDQRLLEQTTSLADTIREATKPIQPGTNGGLSMTDLHTKVDGIVTRLGVVEDQQKQASERETAAALVREQMVAVAAVNAKAIESAVAALGGAVELLPMDRPAPDDH